MWESLTINVELEDFDNATIDHAITGCLVATALKRMFPSSVVEVGLSILSVDNTDYSINQELTNKIYAWCLKRLPREPFQSTVTRM